MASQNDSNSNGPTDDVSRKQVLDAGVLQSSIAGLDAAQSLVSPTANSISSCTTIDTPGEYVFGSDVYSSADTCIEITANNVILDGQHRELQYVGDSDGSVGIRITGSNVVVKNAVLEDWGTCIAHEGYGGKLESNVLDNASNTGDTGILFDGATDVLVRDNDVSAYDTGFQCDASTNNTIRENDIGTVGARALRMDDSHNNTVADNDFVAPSTSVYVTASNGNHFESNDVNGSGNGLVVANSAGNDLLDNVVHDSVYGISLSDTTETTVEDNVVMDNTFPGIRLAGANYCEVANNVVQNNDDGITLEDADENSIRDNVVCGNGSGEQIVVDDQSDGNSIYDNVTIC